MCFTDDVQFAASTREQISSIVAKQDILGKVDDQGLNDNRMVNRCCEQNAKCAMPHA